MSITDNFDRADGDPGANWTDTHGAGASIASNLLKGDTAGDYSGTRYTGVAWSNDQSSQIVKSGAPQYVAPAARMSAGPNWYAYFDYGALQECVAGGAPAQIASGDAYGDGAVAKITAVGTTLEIFVGGVSQGTVVDASLASGDPGVMFYDLGTARVNNWEGTGEVATFLAQRQDPVLRAVHRASLF